MNILLKGIVGSTAYGLAGPESDIDYLGMYAADTADFHGLHLPIDKAASHVSHDPDLTVHEARKYCSLALSCNPTVSELMWLSAYEIQTEHGAELIAIRSAFLSAKRVRDAYFGYATAQLRRLVEERQFQSKMRKRESKHGRHLLRLLDQGLGLYTTGELQIRVDDPQKYIDFGERCAGNPDHAKPTLASYEVAFDFYSSPLPDRPDEAAAERWLRNVRAAHWTP